MMMVVCLVMRGVPWVCRPAKQLGPVSHSEAVGQSSSDRCLNQTIVAECFSISEHDRSDRVINSMRIAESGSYSCKSSDKLTMLSGGQSEGARSVQ